MGRAESAVSPGCQFESFVFRALLDGRPVGLPSNHPTVVQHWLLTRRDILAPDYLHEGASRRRHSTVRHTYSPRVPELVTPCRTYASTGALDHGASAPDRP